MSVLALSSTDIDYLHLAARKGGWRPRLGPELTRACELVVHGLLRRSSDLFYATDEGRGRLPLKGPARIEELSDAAKRAGAVGNLMTASFAEEREAEEALLRTALSAAEPSLGVICTPERFFEKEPQRVALIGVIDSKDPPRRRQLYVNGGGWLTEAVYEFKANHWALVDLSTIGAVGIVGTVSAVLRLDYRVEDVVDRLLRLCAAAADGNGAKRSREARWRAERLRAIATLIDAATDAKIRS